MRATACGPYQHCPNRATVGNPSPGLPLGRRGRSFAGAGVRSDLGALETGAVQVLNDLADPSEGVYSATALMEERLGYTHRMLARHYQMPIVPEAGTKDRNANTNVRFP